MDWVGVAHNRVVDLFARELRAGRIRPGHMCEDIARIAATHKNDILPPGHQTVSDADWRRGAKLGVVRAGCGKRRSASGDFSNASFTAPNHPRPPLHVAAHAAMHPFEYDAVVALLNATVDAVAIADDDVTLGDSLNAILDRANQLSDTAAAQTVQAAVALASHSHDYWQANGTSMAGDIETAYGSCLRTYGDPDTGYQRCVDGGGDWEIGLQTRQAKPEAKFQQVGFRRSPAPFCSLHKKAWVGADIATFVWGELAALLTTGPLGAIMVIPVTTVAGGTASSVAFVGDVVAWLLCKL